jgi:uncharacterized membrane protein
MEAIGPVLVVMAIPMILGWIPPNRVYGFRTASTLVDASVWYAVNASSGRHLLLLGVLMVGLDFLLPDSLRYPVLATVGWVGAGITIAVNWRMANRLRREHQATPIPRIG